MDEFIPMTSVTSGEGQAVTPDVFCFPIQIVNVCFIGDPKQSNEWVLIDAGMPRSAETIVHEAEERFGRNSRPKAIVLTHGHFDHIGALPELAKQWDVPVYAHELEMPFLTGKKNYPPADPAADSGLVAKMSPLFPRHGIDLGSYAKQLPSDGSIPVLSGWRWIHTPGHTPGHISLFRDADRLLLAGDAFVTVRQESLYKVLTQEQELNGPPAYFTTDWHAAWESVKRLEALQPSIAVTGHGIPMSGEALSRGLQKLARNFDELAIPEQSRYSNTANS